VPALVDGKKMYAKRESIPIMHHEERVKNAKARLLQNGCFIGFSATIFSALKMQSIVFKYSELPRSALLRIFGCAK